MSVSHSLSIQSTIQSVFFGASLPVTTEKDLSLYQSPVWATTHECRAERKAAKDAGQLEAKTQLSRFTCHLCTIHMGGNYIEQSIAIYTIAAGSRIREKDRTRPTLYTRNTVVFVCGDCARRRGVPESDIIIRENDWPNTAETVANSYVIGMALVRIEERLQKAKRARLREMQSAVRLVTPTSVALHTITTFKPRPPAQTDEATIAS